MYERYSFQGNSVHVSVGDTQSVPHLNYDIVIIFVMYAKNKFPENNVTNFILLEYSTVRISRNPA